MFESLIIPVTIVQNRVNSGIRDKIGQDALNYARSIKQEC